MRRFIHELQLLEILQGVNETSEFESTGVAFCQEIMKKYAKSKTNVSVSTKDFSIKEV